MVFQIFAVKSMLTMTLHPKYNGQVRRFNHTLMEMLRCYKSQHPARWCMYAPVMGFSYSMATKWSTCTKNLDLVMNHLLESSPWTIPRNVNSLFPRMTGKTMDAEYILRSRKEHYGYVALKKATSATPTRVYARHTPSRLGKQHWSRSLTSPRRPSGSHTTWEARSNSLIASDARPKYSVLTLRSASH